MNSEKCCRENCGKSATHYVTFPGGTSVSYCSECSAVVREKLAESGVMTLLSNGGGQSYKAPSLSDLPLGSVGVCVLSSAPDKYEVFIKAGSDSVLILARAMIDDFIVSIDTARKSAERLSGAKKERKE